MYSNFRDGGIGEMADKVEYLIQQLASDSYWTRYEACKELGELGDVRAFEPLLQRLGDEEAIRSRSGV
jgi:HEAT repeat protein